jgi:hypothetical protein
MIWVDALVVCEASRDKMPGLGVSWIGLLQVENVSSPVSCCAHLAVHIIGQVDLLPGHHAEVGSCRVPVGQTH